MNNTLKHTLRLLNSNGNVLIVGDSILDIYLNYESHGAVEPEVEYCLGGAANIAANLCSFDISVDLFTSIGKDENGTLLTELLTERGIKILPPINTHSQPFRKRIWISDELNDEQKSNNGHISKNGFIPKMDTYDLVIVSEYMTGSLDDSLILNIYQEAKRAQVPILMNSRNTYQPCYHGASYVFVNEREYHRLFKKDQLNIDEFKSVLVTRGPRGVHYYNDGWKEKSNTYRGSINTKGAGDTLLSLYAASILSNMEDTDALLDLMIIGGKLAVNVRHTYVLSIDELLLQYLYAKKIKVLDHDDLIFFNKFSTSYTIGLTNGCFDVFHAGHLDFLMKCKAQCDLLIVGINSDKSIQKIKGSDRPINPLKQRLFILNNLPFVDFIFVIEDQDASSLIDSVEPHVYFKGSEYRNQHMIEKNHAKTIVYIDHEFDVSTTQILKKGEGL